MIADMESNKKLGPIVTKMFLRRMLNILLVFISQSYFKMPKSVRLHATHYIIVKILNERKLQQIASNQIKGNFIKIILRTHIPF